MSDQATPRLKGIIPPLVSPLVGDDALDNLGLKKLVESVIDGGVHGLFVLGTTGEAPSLSYRLRREIVAAVCQQVAGRVPVLVGVTDTSFIESIELARFAAQQGADYIVLSTPYYFPAGQTELLLYIEKFVAVSPLPVMLYNIPSMTKVAIEIETVRKLLDNRRIVGVKDSSGDEDYFRELLTVKVERPDWSLFIGPEHLTAWAVGQGADGGVNGGANIYPRLFVELFDAANCGDSDRLASLQDIVVLLQQIYSVGKYASRHIKATKSALSVKQVCSDLLAQPFNHFLEPERNKVAAILDQIDRRLMKQR